MADSTFETSRLVLRPAAADDLPWILQAINTDSMMRHLGGVRDAARVEASLADDIAAFRKQDGHQRWTVSRKDDNQRIGRVGLFHVRSEAAPDALRGQREVGWMVAEPFWGMGYAAEAARTVIDWAFGRGIPAVFAQTSDSNAASTALMRRLGLARRAELDYVDPDYPEADNPTTVWSVDAEEWGRRRG